MKLDEANAHHAGRPGWPAAVALSLGAEGIWDRRTRTRLSGGVWARRAIRPPRRSVEFLTLVSICGKPLKTLYRFGQSHSQNPQSVSDSRRKAHDLVIIRR